MAGFHCLSYAFSLEKQVRFSLIHVIILLFHVRDNEHPWKEFLLAEI